MRRRADTRVAVVRVLVATLAATLTATLAACTTGGEPGRVSSPSTAAASESTIMGIFFYLPEQSRPPQVTLQLWAPRDAAPRAGITLDSADALPTRSPRRRCRRTVANSRMCTPTWPTAPAT